MTNNVHHHKHKIISYIDLPEIAVQKLEEYFHVVQIKPTEDNKASFFKELKDCRGLIGVGLPITKELLDQAPELKIISNISVGYENFDLDAMTKHKVMATNTPSVSTETTADAMMALLLAAARRISELDRYVKEHKWNSLIGIQQYGIDVHHKTLGIIGMGQIGSAVARRAHHGFGMKILYHNRTRNSNMEEELQAVFCELPKLLSEADFVLLMASANQDSTHLLGEREFSLMRPTAIFVNGSRGENIDEQALVRALKEGKIYGAALDVYEQEPIKKDHELLTFPNVITVPHIGSATMEARTSMLETACKNLYQGIYNLEPDHLINKEVLLELGGSNHV